MTDEQIEKEISEKGLNAPRVTLERINEVIVSEQYHVFSGVLTICCLTLRNGFTVTGESACAHPANYNAELGQIIARSNAVDKVWMLEGYLLKENMYSNKE